MQFHTSGLSTPQLHVIKKVGGVVNPQNFYLAGGTALSIYYGHRQSVDLDWFTPAPLVDPLQFAQLLRDEGVSFVTDSAERGTLYGSVDNIRLSFLEYRYACLEPLSFWEEGPCYLASLDDLACMKLAAVAQSGFRKDFIDVFVLIQNHKPLAEILALYQQKYEVENIISVLTGLVYFDDAEEEPDPLFWSVEWGEVKRQIAGWVRKI